jgi:hypothetical protein
MRTETRAIACARGGRGGRPVAIAINAPQPRYAITLAGKRHAYSLDDWRALTLAQVGVIVADLTGYSTREVLRRIALQLRASGRVVIRPRGSDYPGGVPAFVVTPDHATPKERTASRPATAHAHARPAGEHRARGCAWRRRAGR